MACAISVITIGSGFVSKGIKLRFTKLSVAEVDWLVPS